MNAKITLERLKKWRSDRVLRWVKPATYLYSVIVWRRVNPRYAMSGGDFEGVNDFQFVEVNYTRWRLVANIYQLLLGREKWSDGFRQQVVTIVPPGNKRAIFSCVQGPAVSPYAFYGYPTAGGFDTLGDIQRIDDTVERTYGAATTAKTEGDLYESLTGHRSAALDGSYSEVRQRLGSDDDYEQAEQVAADIGEAFQRRHPAKVCIEGNPTTDGFDWVKDKFLNDDERAEQVAADIGKAFHKFGAYTFPRGVSVEVLDESTPIDADKERQASKVMVDAGIISDDVVDPCAAGHDFRLLQGPLKGSARCHDCGEMAGAVLSDDDETIDDLYRRADYPDDGL